ncbi:nucleolar complex protein 4 homolog [Garra rufa]|uniref:nucleolar complex protein 4 homolog n=1 Tax=Garra rufa TaxID=137080 RepID=UPI003CCE6EBC
MAPSTDSNVKGENSKVLYKKDINTKTDRILQNKKHANDIFDVIEYLQSENDKQIIFATNACRKIFCTLFDKRDLYVGDLPEEEDLMSGDRSAEEKYRIFMRHRYNSCVENLLENIGHEAFQVKEASLCALMKFVEAEGKYPLQDPDSCEHFHFPRELLRTLVAHILSEKEDMSLLISRFQEFLEMDDVRYYVMSSVRDSMSRKKKKTAEIPVYYNNVFTLISNIKIPSQEPKMTKFLVKQDYNLEKWKVAKVKEHKLAFEQMWMLFLKFKLPSNMYKKILVILHESVMPQMSDPTLLMDFLSAAYDIGGAISLLALNGLFVLIHQHNLDYPDFYKKLYGLLDPSVFHVKYRARFFYLVNIFLSSTHLPAYLVAAFVKRFARLSLTAPPTALLILLPFICNLIRRHPSCRVLIHRPNAAEEPCDDPYVMEEKDPAKCHALESSLWEIKTLQKHYHPEVSKAAYKINEPLTEQEEDISELLELSTFELMKREIKAERKAIPLEYDKATELLKSSREVLGVHFSLE